MCVDAKDAFLHRIAGPHIALHIVGLVSLSAVKPDRPLSGGSRVDWLVGCGFLSTCLRLVRGDAWHSIASQRAAVQQTPNYCVLDRFVQIACFCDFLSLTLTRLKFSRTNNNNDIESTLHLRGEVKCCGYISHPDPSSSSPRVDAALLVKLQTSTSILPTTSAPLHLCTSALLHSNATSIDLPHRQDIFFLSALPPPGITSNQQ